MNLVTLNFHRNCMKDSWTGNCHVLKGRYRRTGGAEDFRNGHSEGSARCAASVAASVFFVAFSPFFSGKHFSKDVSHMRSVESFFILVPFRQAILRSCGLGRAARS